jgi:hypothetical protein
MDAGSSLDAGLFIGGEHKFIVALWAAEWTCSWRAGLKMLPLAVPPKQKRRQGFKPIVGGEDCGVYGASI